MLSGQHKAILAIVLAAAGISAAAWSVLSLQRRPAPRSADAAPSGPARERSGQPNPGNAPPAADLPPGAEHRTVQGGDDEGSPVDPLPVGPFDFRSVKSDSQSIDAGDAIEATVAEAARSFDWLDLARRDHKTAASAARIALIAPARGRETFNSAIVELKGDPVGGDSEAGTIAAMFEGATIDVSHLRIKPGSDEPLPGGGARPPDGPGRARMMMRVERSGDGPDDEETAIGVPVSALFPLAADEVSDGEKTIEIKCPARLPGVDVADGRAEIGVVLVRERSTGTWQPIMYNLYTRDRAAATAKAKSVRDQRQSQ